MARNSDNGLYLPLKIDMSSWEQSLLQADETLQKEMRKMRSAMKDLRMRYDVEITGAKLAGDDVKALELETEKLNRLFVEQENVVNALNNAYQKSVQEKGENSKASQALAQQLVRESKELDRLKNQINVRNQAQFDKEEKIRLRQLQEQQRLMQEQEKLRQRQLQEQQKQLQEQEKIRQKQLQEQQKQLQEQQRQADALAQKQSRAKEDMLSGALQMVSPKLEGARRAIQGITGSLDIMGGTASKVGAALGKMGGYAVGIGLVAGAVKKLKDHLDETRASILKATEDTYKLTEHLSDLADTTQLPIDEVTKLSEACKVAGANIDVIAPALNRLDKAILGGDTTLEKFGVQLKDASGGLKSTTEQLNTLAEGYSRMKAEGRGGEFVAQLGKNAQALLPLISRLADADFNNVQKMIADAPKVAVMLEDDAKLLGELDRALEVLNDRLANAKGAEGAQLKMEDLLRSIENAKDELQALQDTAGSRKYEMSGISALDEEMHKFDKSIITAKSSLSALMSELQGYLTMRVAYGLDSIRNNSFEDFDDYQVRKALEYQEKLNQRDNARIQAQISAMSKPQTIEDENKKIREDIDKNYAYADQEMRDALYTQKVEENAKKRELARQRESELAEQATADLKKQLRDLTATEEQRKINAINDNYEKNAEKDVALAEKIRQAELKKLAEEGTKKRIALEEKLTSVTLSEQEKRINAINKEYEANAKVDAVVADKIRQAELKRIEEETTKARIDAMDKVRAVMNTDFENRMNQIEREKEAWIKAGADKVAVEQATQKQITELYKQQSQERMSEAERLLTEQKQVIKDIQKGLSDSEIMERANKRFMKNRGINQSMIDTLDEVGFDRVNYLADARQRLLGRFGGGFSQMMQQAQDAIGFQIGKHPQQQIEAPQTQAVPNIQVNLTFDNTVVEDMSSMQKIADKVSEVIQPAIEKALRGESTYGY